MSAATPAASPVLSWRDFFLQESTSPPPPPAAALLAEDEPDRCGQQLGDFEILRRLGAGGMGTVYEAIYAGNRRRYALKILARAHADDPVMVKRFEHEYLALSRVYHEAVVTPFFRGDVDGVRFYSMELVVGEPLDRVLARGRLDPLLVARIGVQLATGLEAFHRAGIVHRDLKPNNVLLCAGDRIKLIDPGIAKLLPPFYEEGEMRTPVGRRILTPPEIHLGTPGYIAPEVAAGEKASPRQDIFGLGVTLYRLATGEYPYPVMVPIAADDEPRWSEEIGRPIPFALEEVLRRAVRVSPALRQHSMADVADQLQMAVEEIVAEREDAPASAERTRSSPATTTVPPARVAPWRGIALFLMICLGVDLGLRVLAVAQDPVGGENLVAAPTSIDVEEPVAPARPAAADPATALSELPDAPPEVVAVVETKPEPELAAAPEPEQAARVAARPQRLPAAAFRRSMEGRRADLELCARNLRGAPEVSVTLEVGGEGDVVSVGVRPESFLSLAAPNVARASAPIEAQAVALEQEGRHAEAAELWQQIVAHADDDRQRTRAIMHGANAWRDAFAESGDPAQHCAAEAIVAGALADVRVDARAREEFEAMLADLRSSGIACTRRVEILVEPPSATSPVAAPSIPPAAKSEAPSTPPPAKSEARSSDRPAARAGDRRIVAGGVMLALAAPALGGLVYAALADRAIVRGYRQADEDRKATGTYDHAAVDRLDAEAPIVRGLAIGFGVSSAILTGVGVALVVSGRRQRAAELALSPQTRPDLAGVVLRGRF